MTRRDNILTAFIARCGWDDASTTTVAGDASNRRYLRLTRPHETAILMDAPPDKGEDVTPFIDVAEYLTGQGFSAPRILARDVAHGLLLIEDLGDDLYARVLTARPDLENSLYSAAIDVLLDLHDRPPPVGLAPYAIPYMTEMAGLSVTWYLAGLAKDDAGTQAQLDTAMAAALSQLPDLTTVLIQRDYHAENLLWLPDRTGVARVGLLDFQDAMLGHRAYDLVSLLQDARRDVSPKVEAAMIDRYVTRSGADEQAFRLAYATLGAQRNLRILGVFARLCLRDGKPHYVDFIPRVWAHLMRDLTHPALADLATIIHRSFPGPSAANLQKLKDQCLTKASV